MSLPALADRAIPFGPSFTLPDRTGPVAFSTGRQVHWSHPMQVPSRSLVCTRQSLTSALPTLTVPVVLLAMMASTVFADVPSPDQFHWAIAIGLCGLAACAIAVALAVAHRTE